VQVACDGEAVEADSALELMMFAAGPGTDITISASGPDAEKAVDALADLVNRGFDEED
jgi:phosphocarrier protein HPr